MKKIFLIFLCLIAATVVAAPPGHYGPYDPGAARSNLSNVDATATPSMTSITLSDKVKAAWADILGDIYASGTVKVSTGTAAAPAYSFSSDPNTGIYSPSADNLSIVANGSVVASFSPNTLVVPGLVTIGRNSPAGVRTAINTTTTASDTTGLSLALGRRNETVVMADGFGSQLAFYGQDINDIELDNKKYFGKIEAVRWGSNTVGKMIFRTGVNGNEESMTILPGNEVLIATSTDAGDYKLQVNGNAYVRGHISTSLPDTNTDGAYAGSFINNSSHNASQHGLYVSVANGGGYLVNMVASGTTRFRILNNGVVTLQVDQVYADNAAAISGGLSAGNLYRTSDGTLKIVY